MRAARTIDRGLLVYSGALAGVAGGATVLGLVNVDASWSSWAIVGGLLGLAIVLATFPIATSLQRGNERVGGTAGAAPAQAGADASVLSRLESSIEEIRDTERDTGRTRYFRHPLVRLTLPASEADELLRLLWRYDITRHHIRPTLDNAAQAFKYARALWPTFSGESKKKKKKTRKSAPNHTRNHTRRR